MEYPEFSSLTKATVRGFMDRIPTRYHDGFQSLLEGGELRLAVEDLMAALEDDQVPVTPAERENLARMLAYLKEPVSRLDALNVTASPGG